MATKLFWKPSAKCVKHIQMYLIPRARHDLFHEEKNGGSEAAFDTLTNWLFENT